MFAQLANTILHGVRIFDEAAKNTTPAEMNRPDDCDEARSGHHRGENCLSSNKSACRHQLI